MNTYKENLIIGAGPAGLQCAYYFKKHNIDYLVLERSGTCGSFIAKYPHSRNMISLNKIFTGSSDPEFNLRHDWNSLLNDEDHLFTRYTSKFYPESDLLHQYLNDFYAQNDLNVKFNANVIRINKTVGRGSERAVSPINYELHDGDGSVYRCKNLIIATGTGVPVIPDFKVNTTTPIKHYSDYSARYFKEPENLRQYQNKKVLLFGGGNCAYELANILNEHCSSVFVIGRKLDLSMSSHYVGDVRSIYYPFFDTFYLKTLGGIDEIDKRINSEIEIGQVGNQYQLKLGDRPYYANPKHNLFDKIIYCTGWKFDNSIFSFKIDSVIGDKYPAVRYNFESTNNKNLFFIGALMHSIDYRRSSGGFIHGFRYLIKLFVQMNYGSDYGINYDTNLFPFDKTMKCYHDLADHISKRINTASSLYQMHGTIIDVFYYDTDKKHIMYYNGITLEIASRLFTEVKAFVTVKLTYGEKNYDLKTINAFNKNDPKFLHPEITIFEKDDSGSFKPIDKVIIEEDILSDFSDQKVLKKILRTLKGCPLIL